MSYRSYFLYLSFHPFRCYGRYPRSSIGFIPWISFQLPRLLSTFASHFTVPPKTVVDPTLFITLSKPMDNLSFKLGNCSGEILSKMGVDQMRILLMNVCNILSSAAPTPSVFVQHSNLFSILQSFFLSTSTSSLTPKNNYVRSNAPFTGFMMFTGRLIVLDTQSIFDYFF